MLRIYNNVRQSIVAQYDFASFNRYMADVIGLLQPITNANVYKTLAELILKDTQECMNIIFMRGIEEFFKDEDQLKMFIKFVNALISD